MANPCRPFSRAAAMFSSGLETPSPEKKVCVWRSMLKAIGGRLVWAAPNAKNRFQGVGAGLRGAGAGRTNDFAAQRRHRRGPRGIWLSPRRVLPFPDFFPRTARESANAGDGNSGGPPGRDRNSLLREARRAEGDHGLVSG